MVIFFCDENTIRPDLALGHMAGKSGSCMPVYWKTVCFKISIIYDS
jgi:hypothetical protein